MCDMSCYRHESESVLFVVLSCALKQANACKNTCVDVPGDPSLYTHVTQPSGCCFPIPVPGVSDLENEIVEIQFSIISLLF